LPKLELYEKQEKANKWIHAMMWGTLVIIVVAILDMLSGPLSLFWVLMITALTATNILNFRTIELAKDNHNMVVDMANVTVSTLTQTKQIRVKELQEKLKKEYGNNKLHKVSKKSAK
jgi:hypothetical protein